MMPARFSFTKSGRWDLESLEGQLPTRSQISSQASKQINGQVKKKEKKKKKKKKEEEKNVIQALKLVKGTPQLCRRVTTFHHPRRKVRHS